MRTRPAVNPVDTGRKFNVHQTFNLRTVSTVKECNLYLTPFFINGIDLISTRSIWLHPYTVLETTGEGGGLLLSAGLILKWFSLLLIHFWIRLILVAV